MDFLSRIAAEEAAFDERLRRREEECLCQGHPSDPAFQECFRCTHMVQCCECLTWTLKTQVKDDVCPDCWEGTTAELSREFNRICDLGAAE